MVRKVASRYAIKSVMTFGGEPLLYPDDVCMIHSAARDAGIPLRQVITNGFFSSDEAKIKKSQLTLRKAASTIYFYQSTHFIRSLYLSSL